MKIELSHIDAVIFDLGGVLLNLDYSLTILAFEKLGLKDSNEFFSQKSQSGFFDDFEMGKISALQFRQEIRNLISRSITDSQIDEAWNAMLLDFPLPRFQFLKEISETKRIFLLSNTNEIHMSWFKNYVNALVGESAFFEVFKVAYLSNEIGLRKPNSDVFKFVLSQNQLNPIRTLFIDDSEQHIIGANKVGLQTHWLLPEEEITKVLGAY